LLVHTIIRFPQAAHFHSHQTFEPNTFTNYSLIEDTIYSCLICEAEKYDMEGNLDQSSDGGMRNAAASAFGIVSSSQATEDLPPMR
jgi:hypothetical protein